MPPRPKTILTNLELQVMRAVWEADTAALTVREVVERLNRGRRRRPLAYNTVHTMLTILRDKGVVAHEPGAGRAHRFRARVTQKQVTTSMVKDLVERLYDGRVHPLLVQLVDREALSRDELETLREIIDGQLEDGEADAGPGSEP